MDRKLSAASETNGAPRELRFGLETVLGIPFNSGNAIEAYRNGDEIFPPMLRAISRAERRIEFLTFIYWTGNIAEKFVEALSERARAGVEVLIMLDGFGALPMPGEFIERMRGAGCHIRWFRPIPRWRVWQTDNRTHRKILVCDGIVGFTGGVGIAEEWEGNAQRPEDWRDTHFCIRGPAVLGLRSAFYEDWMQSELSVAPAIETMVDPGRRGSLEVQVIPASASIGRSAISALHDALILLARRRLRIATAYFSPTPDTVSRLLAAARRGVEIEVLIPGPYQDKRVAELAGSDAIGPMLDDGVRIWRFMPTMYHTKVITLDGQLSCIGSANFNHRSVSKDDEISVNVLDADFTALMDRHLDEDLSRSEEIDPKAWRRRGTLRRLRELASSCLTPQT